MTKLIPKRYYKDVFEINYDKLKRDMVKCLLFDLDNTIAPVNIHEVDLRYVNLFKKLKKDFIIIMVSNALPKRTKYFASILDIDYVALSWKPHHFVYNKILKKYGFKSNEVACIGDQLYTDVLGANKNNLLSILVDPISDYDSFFTRLNRKKEKKFMNDNELKRGKYYE